MDKALCSHQTQKKNNEVINTLKNEIMTIETQVENTPPPEIIREDVITPEIMSKIDNALTHIHVGR